ncbi:MAG: hypothetical protein EOS40_33205 [Mesorhizobium sp.]|nr:MAG: hypothetical protein EOQ40_31180 [Mesorhizobium sp.]RWD96371.1 MAG: hypothetical protein EOS40_33205 [Mesorhizobium sp.]
MKLPISPFVGEMADRPEGGAVPPASQSISLPRRDLARGKWGEAAFLRPPLPCRASPTRGRSRAPSPAP